VRLLLHDRLSSSARLGINRWEGEGMCHPSLIALFVTLDCLPSILSAEVLCTQDKI